eukprot:scaffold651124_cov36-Prasinocladus_malaysianus.AAC.1
MKSPGRVVPLSPIGNSPIAVCLAPGSAYGTVDTPKRLSGDANRQAGLRWAGLPTSSFFRRPPSILRSSA